MDNIIIRRCTRDEIPEVMRINERTLPENYPRFFYESILERFPESFLVAEYLPGRVLIGYVMFRVERGLEPGIHYIKKGHLVSIAVLKEFQGKRVGSSLLVEGLKQVSKYGVDLFVLEVRKSNQVAINLYNKLLFKVKKELPRYYRDGEDAYYMVLPAKDFSNNILIT
ncbi:MAG: GNAT family N-acetyltransferase [Promethearchaeota archaeon]